MSFGFFVLRLSIEMTTKRDARENLKKWFWMFKYKMVDEYPEYSVEFDLFVEIAYSAGLLYEMMEFAYRYLEIEGEQKGGMDKLKIEDYVEAFEYGFREWLK